MKLSLVVPTHNRNTDILELLASIQGQAFDFDSFELIIVSNLKDPFFEAVSFRQAIDGLNVRVACAGVANVNRARNMGLDLSKGEIVFLVDDDCRLPQSNYLERILEVHQRFPDATAIGGGYEVDQVAGAMDKAYNCVARQWQSLDFYGDYESSRLVGGNVSYKRLKLLNSGLRFDEKLDFGGTEAEFHQRLLKHGFQTLYIPDLNLIHKTSLDEKSLAYKAYKQAQGYLKYDIADGFSIKQSRSYQSKRLMLAKEVTISESEFLETVDAMRLYDWVYNYCCENPKASSRKTWSKACAWKWANQTRARVSTHG